MYYNNFVQRKNFLYLTVLRKINRNKKGNIEYYCVYYNKKIDWDHVIYLNIWNVSEEVIVLSFQFNFLDINYLVCKY